MVCFEFESFCSVFVIHIKLLKANTTAAAMATIKCSRCLVAESESSSLVCALQRFPVHVQTSGYSMLADDTVALLRSWLSCVLMSYKRLFSYLLRANTKQNKMTFTCLYLYSYENKLFSQETISRDILLRTDFA